MDRIDAGYMREMQQEAKAERETALNNAGPLLDDMMQIKMEAKLEQEFVPKDKIPKVIDHLQKNAGRDPEDTTKQALKDALESAGVTNKAFVSRVSGLPDLNETVKTAIDARETRMKTQPQPQQTGPKGSRFGR